MNRLARSGVPLQCSGAVRLILGGGTRVPATRFHCHTSLAAHRAIVFLVILDRKFEQSVRFHRELDLPTAAIDQSAGGNYTTSGLFDHANRFLRGSARGPHVLYHQNVLPWLQSKSSPHGHRPAAIALHEHCRYASRKRIFSRGQGTRDLLPDDYATKRRRHNGVDLGIRKERGQGMSKPFGEAWILQYKGALHIRAAVKTAGQLKVAMAYGPRRLEYV
jgi:hypothetical protein